MNNPQKEKGQIFLDFINNTSKTHIEFYVDGLGWLILLKENIEIVSDNWFTSTKFVASKFDLHDNNPHAIELVNVYRFNPSFVENDNNVKYNLHFDHLIVFADKITAFH